ncbi:MAG: 16S rRNA (guanine(527)-N(7))-methyltransferase RsmG, partial [SAR324 cluster bacterium]|nr:16S rRNA (guanine(527)-N(7))-methyltransferase RsmG [SAR324 cluster bacterium]
ETIDRHFLDSLSVARVYKFNGIQSLIDVGTGAGFPGMALKIAFPDLKVTLMDSVKKKLSFLEDVVKYLGLRDVELLHGRAEDLGRDLKYREKFDLVTARAVSELKILLELTFPFVRVQGRVFLWKGVDVENEIEASKGALKALGIDKAAVERCNLGKNQGTIIYIVKKSKLSKDFPRSPKKILSKPL